MNIDQTMNQFRIASRELFNHYFHVSNPRENCDAAWELHERFVDIQDILFQKMVIEPASIAGARYGEVQTKIKVVISTGDSVPIMINREIDSGYWDHPLDMIGKEALLLFIEYFDWDNIEYHDNRYVRVQIANFASHPETVGKHALINSYNVQYEIA